MKISKIEVDDKVADLELESQKLEKLNIDYKVNCGNFFQRLLNKEEFYVLRKKKMEDKFTMQEEKVSELEKMVYENSDINFDEGMNFLANVVSTVEKESYAYCNITISSYDLCNMLLGLASKNYALMLMESEENVSILAKEEAIDEIVSTNFSSIKQVEKVLSKYNGKYSILNERPLLEIHDGEEVPTYLTASFPYLEEVCKYIVNKKIANPDLSDEEFIDLCYDDIIVEDLKPKTK